MLSKRHLFIIWLFGFISGFSLLIAGNTLNYWLAKEGVNITTIGIFSLISLPYAVNFIWAPIIDHFKLGLFDRLLGHRLSWACLLQLSLALSVFLISLISPVQNIMLLGLLGLIISFFSSTQDMVLGAMRTEIIKHESQGAASGIYTFGYRIGMLISSSGAIYFSTKLGWNQIYKLFAVITLTFPLLLIISLRSLPILNRESEQYTESSTEKFFTKILKPIGSKGFIVMALSLLILYRLPDNFINVMINPFLLHLGFGEKEIASIGKFFGILSAIFGGLIASYIMQRLSILRAILLFGILHAIAHSFFVILESYDTSLLSLILIMGFESLTGGMTMTAYIAFIASMCQGKYRATQYAFFSSMMGLSRSIFPSLSGYIVIEIGWSNFFILASFLCLPSLLIAQKLKNFMHDR